MKIQAAAIQMPCDVLDVPANLQRADELLRMARDRGAELRSCPSSSTPATASAPTTALTARRRRAPRCRTCGSAAGSGGWRSPRDSSSATGRHLYDSLAFCSPDGEVQIYRKRNLVFWERFRFHPGRSPLVVPTPLGRIGLAICADMIYRRVWDDYRGRIDLAVVAAAWPDFACRETGRRHWLLGHVGPLSDAIPAKVAVDLGIPVIFANQCGETRTTIPVLRHDDPRPVRRPEQHLRRPPRHPRPRRAGTLGPGRPHHPPFQARIEIVEFYVPLGPRGFLLRIGTFLIGVFGGLVYRQAARRRALLPANPPADPCPGRDRRRGLTTRGRFDLRGFDACAASQARST